MKKLKKWMALGFAAAMTMSLTACGSNSSTGGTTTAAGQSGAGTAAGTEAPASTGKKDANSITISWWGGDSRHEATIKALDKFKELNPEIQIESNYGAWTGWEDKMSTQFFSKSAPDVNQINWNWITSFSSDGSAFKDLNEYKDIIDLTQFPQSALDQCTVAGKLQALPVALTGRIFYFNKTTFENAGISIPTSLAELKAAGTAFKEKLGDEYYPIALGEYDRMMLMVYYLESVYGKNWVEEGTLNYSQEEIEAGLQFIQDLEDAHVTPSIKTIKGDGAESLDKNPKWMEGKYAGIFEWDSAASKFEKALNEGQEFVVGDYFKDFGQYQGGFSKVSLAFAISESASNPEACAKLINFLVNDPAGVELLGSERGIPLSKAAVSICEEKGLLDKTVAEANEKMVSWTQFALDPKFEDAKLKGEDGVYYDVMAGLSYGDYDLATAAETLIDGINEILGK